MVVCRAMIIGRGFLLGVVAAACLSLPAAAQTEPIRIGFLSVRTGPLAAGGRQMEEGINLLLKQRNNMLAGRKAVLIIADTGGQPAQAKTRAHAFRVWLRFDMMGVNLLQDSRLARAGVRLAPAWIKARDFSRWSSARARGE